MKIYLRKIGNSYIVDSGDDSDIKNGEVVSAEIKRPRNYRFLKKYFTLMNYAFGVWEPDCLEYNGKPVGKSFERFREDITILSGYYTLTENIKGEVRAEAKSISFGKMDDDEFACLYSKTIGVLLKHVLKNYTREDIDNVIDNIIGFD
ncbi:DUF1367 family protein [Candidatus Pacearchaeota archaeon]|nr:DUF1367 family protein [Candidatus Pacearchaeota archaeon]